MRFKRMLFYGILALIMLAVIKDSFAVDVKLVSSTPNCISCESIYSITSDKTSLSINENSLWFEFRKPATELMHGKDISTLRDWKVEMQDERLREWTEQVLKDEGCTTKDKIEANGTTKITTCNPVYETITKSETEKYWKPMQDKELSVGKEIIIKVSGNIKVNSQVDNVLVLKEGATFTKYTMWSWWNNSYLNRMQVNMSNITTTNISVLINGTNGFKINNTKQLVWIRPQINNNIYVYYNNETSYTIANDTAEIPFEIEMGNRSSNSPSFAQYGIFHFKEGTGTNTNNSGTSNKNGTFSGATWTTGKIGNSLYIDTNTDRVDTSGWVKDTTYTISFWFNNTGNWETAGDRAFAWYASGSYQGYWLHTRVSGTKLSVEHYDGASGRTYPEQNVGTSNAWVHYLFVMSPTNRSSWQNGVLMESSGTSVTLANSQTGEFSLGTGSGRSDAKLGFMDEYQYWSNQILSHAEIPQLYNAQIGTAGYGDLLASENGTPADTVSYVVNYTTPVYELSNQSFWINLSWTGGVTDATALKLEYNNTNYSISLLDNGSAWKRYNTSIIIPLTAGTSLADENRTFKFYYNFTNSTGTFTTNTSTTLQKVMEIYFINSLSFDVANADEISYTTATVNISKTGVTNYSQINWSVVMEVNGTNYTITQNTTNNETFDYTQFIRGVLVNNSQINYSAFLNINWNGINASRSGFTPHQHLLQKYFVTGVASNSATLPELSNTVITATIDTLPPPLLVALVNLSVLIEYNNTNHTVTTNTTDYTNYNYSEFIGIVTTNNTKINYTAYLIIDGSVRTINKNNQSLIQNYFPVTTNNGNISEGSTSIVTVTITNVSGPFTSLTGIFNVSVVWNGTSYQANQISNTVWQLNHTAPAVNAITSITELGKLNITYGSTSVIRNHSVTQNIWPFGIDNCSTYTTQAINFYLYDETSMAALNGSLAGYFSLAPAVNKTFNITWPVQSIFGLCINPPDANITVDAQMEYSSAGYSVRNYYFDGTRLDNSTDIVNLYLNSNTSLVVLGVTDQDDNEIQDALIYIQAYDLPTNSFKTVEIAKTDFRGQAYAQLVLYTQWYKFVLVYNGNTVLETDATKLLTTTLNFRISLTEDELAGFTEVHDITCSLAWNNATSNFEFTFLNPTATNVNALLEVKKQDVYSTNIINSSSLTASSGLIIVGIGSQENKTYIGTGTINGIVCGNPVSQEFGGRWQTVGGNGLFLVILLLVALVSIFSWSPTISIIALMLGVVLTVVMQIFYLSWTPALITYLILGGIAVYRLARENT